MEEWRSNRDDSRLRCARCVFLKQTRDAEENLEATCNECGHLKPLSDFGAQDLKMGCFRTKERGWSRWRCLDCRSPARTFTSAEGQRCNRRELFATSHNLKDKDRYLCREHRYPPCACGAPRPTQKGYDALSMATWTCPKCRGGDALGLRLTL